MKVITALTTMASAIVLAGAAPARADAAWELRSTREVSADPVDLLTSVVRLLPLTGTPCVPASRDVYVYPGLTVETWWNPQTLEVRYIEHGWGSASISTNCAGTSVTVEAEVADYAPAGSPVLMQDGGQRVTRSDPRNGTHTIAASASDTTVVTYYDPAQPIPYSRGAAYISVRATGYYTNPGKPAARFGCVQATWGITPTPYGPIFMNDAPHMSSC